MTQRSYRRIMLGAKSMYARQCHEGGFVGGHWGFENDLTGEFGDDWQNFNRRYRPIYLANNPGKTMVAAGLACGMLWTICKGMKIGDIVISPDAEDGYFVGEVTSDYYFASGEILPQRRRVTWLPVNLSKANLSEALQNSMGAQGTVADITRYSEEIERLIGRDVAPAIMANDPIIEDASSFALERHLEDFLASNWSQTELGKKYDIVSDEGQLIGRQYPTDTGPIDILCLAKDQSHYLVVELKRGRASDNVVGQIQRYMGYVQSELTKPGQLVRGCIIALEDDLRLRRALSVAPNIDFFRYQVTFKLMPA